MAPVSSDPTIEPTLRSWELRDPAAMIHAVHHRRPLSPGDAVLALVERPSTKQQLLDAELLSAQDTPPVGEAERAALILGAAHRLSEGRTRTWPPTLAFVVLVARTGRVVIDQVDLAWWIALATADHNEPAFVGDLILVTEHGWRCHGDSTAGRHPALVAA